MNLVVTVPKRTGDKINVRHVRNLVVSLTKNETEVRSLLMVGDIVRLMPSIIKSVRRLLTKLREAVSFRQNILARIVSVIPKRLLLVRSSTMQSGPVRLFANLVRAAIRKLTDTITTTASHLKLCGSAFGVIAPCTQERN